MIEEFWWMTWFSVGMKGGKNAVSRGGGVGGENGMFLSSNSPPHPFSLHSLRSAIEILLLTPSPRR